MSLSLNSSPSRLSVEGSDDHQHHSMQPLQSASVFNTPKKDPLFLPEEEDILKSPSLHFPKITPGHMHHQKPPQTLPHASSTDLTDTSVGPIMLSQKSMDFFTIASQTVAQPDTHSTLVTLPLEPAASRSIAGEGSQSPPQLSNISQGFGILSHLRHLAASRPRIAETFEEQTRVLFRRENAPSPEPRLEFSESTVPQQPVEAELVYYHKRTKDHSMDEPAEPINSVLPQSLRGAVEDAQSRSETLVDPIKGASEPITTVMRAEEDAYDDLPVRSGLVRARPHTLIQPYSDAETEVQPPCDELSTKAKGKQKAADIESESGGQNDADYVSTNVLDDDNIFGDEDSICDGDGGSLPDDSVFGGDSDISEERTVPPPPKRSMTSSDDEATARKRHKSVSSQLSEDRIIDVDDSDEETSIQSSNTAGPSRSVRPRSLEAQQVQKATRLQEWERAALQKWQRKMTALWEGRKTTPQEELNRQAMEVLNEIFDARWSLLLPDIADVKLVARLRKIYTHEFFDKKTRDKAYLILDAFEQRFKRRSLFDWNGDKIVGKKPE